MKNITKYILVLVIGITLSCNDDENQIVPDFLDGTEYGVLLDVEVTSAVEVSLADISTYELGFNISFKGDKRPISSIVVNKSYVSSVNGESSLVEEEVIVDFPASMTLSSNELVSGIPSLLIDDLEAGDSFNISFVINYVDGGVVDRFDSSMRTNFAVAIVD
ncbi:hypothetical protein [Spongiimicrobium sp. 3-5]|uniref:hypothetical protein n=1 Tax=Spongiimicrobium sp. 3-5 TaxID=3332596 RepID=UPI00397F4E7D